MNSFIETLNQWGANLLHFAWPMLWQSSLLIALVFTLDFLSARKIRASIRYGLWLAVLVKLLLPPTLAMPTSAAWWLFQSKPAAEAPAVKKYVVTYDTTMPQIDFVRQISPVRAPEPELNSAGRALLASSAVSAGLLLWLVFRWRQVMRKVCGATVNNEFAGTLDAAQQMAGLCSRVRLKMVDGRMSPAVCGLFNPAILLPRTLVEKLSAGQLRAVLLHELFHLRRKDVWVNCAQALLQIVFWWHPLLWLANVRIRRVREEAVDDAVMLALRDESESYAPTLLEVAKLAFTRPQLSLGLVGIMESRSALRQRIERLVDFRPPRKAGLTLLSVCGIFAFSAVALPMGEAPAPAEKPLLPAANVSPPPTSTQTTNIESVLILSRFFQIRADDAEKVISDLKFNRDGMDIDSSGSVAPDPFNRIVDRLHSSGNQPFFAPQVLTLSGQTAEMFVGNDTNSVNLVCKPFVTGGSIGLSIQVKMIDTHGKVAVTNQFDVRSTVENHGGIVVRLKNRGGSAVSNLLMVVNVQIVTNGASWLSHQQQTTLIQKRRSDRAVRGTVTGRREIVKRLHGIRLEKVAYDAVPLGVVLDNLTDEIALRDADKLGVRFIEPEDVGLVTITIKPALTNILADDVLDAITMVANAPIKYSIFDGGVEFSWKDQKLPILYSRTFKINPDVFFSNLRQITVTNPQTQIQALKTTFSNAGVDLAPTYKTIFYNDRLGMIFVRATLEDLDAIENVMASLNNPLPEIHIKARFFEVPKRTLDGFGTMLDGFRKMMGITNQPDELVGILTSENAKVALRTLESRAGTEELAEPEVTTTSGRQTEMRATKSITVVTNFAFIHGLNSQSDSITPQTTTLEFGPVVDVFPNVQPDGYTIDLRTTASVTELLGYDRATNTIPVRNELGEEVYMPKISPSFAVRKANANIKLWDGQTIVLGGMKTHFYDGGKAVSAEPDYFVKAKAARGQPDEEDKDMLVFITVTLVDPAGNRIHSDEEMPFAESSIPPQSTP